MGTPIVWTATATGGSAPQFRFWVQAPGGPFVVLQDYSSSSTFTWTPTVVGTHVVIVWARSSSSSATFEATAGAAFSVMAGGAPVTAVTLAPDKASPQPVGTPIVWTATATGGTAPQFRFWVQAPGGPFVVLQDYGSSPTFTWTPTVVGTHVVIVWARSSGSAATFEASAGAAFSVTTGGAPLTAVSLTPDKASPQPVNTTIVWTATATGGTAPQFRFWVQAPGGPFVVLQDYSSSPTFTWTPTVVGTHVVIVWARSTGSSATFEAFAVAAFSVTAGGTGPQVRFLNGLVRSNGQSFTAELRSAQGNIWFSFSGVLSAYQPTARSLSNFEFRDGGTLVGTFPGTFNLPTTGPQLFTLVLTIQSNQLVLGLVQDTASSGDLSGLDVTSAVPIHTLGPSEAGGVELRYGPVR